MENMSKKPRFLGLRKRLADIQKFFASHDTLRIARNARRGRTTVNVRAAILGKEIASITRVQYHRRLELALVVEVVGLMGVSGEMA
jgi:hypothetical protein